MPDYRVSHGSEHRLYVLPSNLDSGLHFLACVVLKQCCNLWVSAVKPRSNVDAFGWVIVGGVSHSLVIHNALKYVYVLTRCVSVVVIPRHFDCIALSIGYVYPINHLGFVLLTFICQ